VGDLAPSKSQLERRAQQGGEAGGEMMSRVELTDTPKDIIVKLCKGNPGALRVLVDAFQSGGTIDPDALFGGVHVLLELDELDIVGPRIWILYKDVCGQDMVTFIAVLRAWQLGILQRTQLVAASAGWSPCVDFNPAEILAQVKSRLPRFGEAAASGGAQ